MAAHGTINTRTIYSSASALHPKDCCFTRENGSNLPRCAILEKEKSKQMPCSREKATLLYYLCNAQITESRKQIEVIFVYGLDDTPMMLGTNREIRSKDDAIRVVIVGLLQNAHAGIKDRFRPIRQKYRQI